MTATTTTTGSSATEKELTTGGIVKGAAIGAAAGGVGNALLFIIAGAVGVPMVAEFARGQPAAALALGQVIGASFVPAIVAALFALLLNKLSSRPSRILVGVALVFGLFSMMGPATIPGAGTGLRVILALMHVVAGVAIIAVMLIDRLSFKRARGWLLGWGGGNPRRRAVALLKEPAASRGPLEVRGSVRALAIEPLRSPIHEKECVAWRLVGRSSSGPIDDAAVSPFSVEGDPHGPAQIEPGAATIALQPLEPVRPAALARETRTFLIDRLIDPDDSSFVLAEAIIVEGDDVILHGASGREAPNRSEVGYRTEGRTRVVAGSLGVPLHLAKPRPDRRARGKS